MNASDTHEIESGGEPAPDSAPTPETNVHETLLEGVSTDAIVAHGVGESDAPLGDRPETFEPEAKASEAQESEVQESEAEESETEDSQVEESRASESEPDSAALADDLTVVPEAAVEAVPFAAEIVEAAAADAVVPGLPLLAIPSPAQDGLVPAFATAALPDLRKLLDLAASPRIAQAMGELGEVNATVLTYLRGEGTATLAHWQALSAARNPADAIRLQVDEMQRAADASLSCFAALAKRAGRFTSAIGPR